MNIRPILSALLRNKTAPLLIAAQVALTLAILCNAIYIIQERLATAARPTGADEMNLFELVYYAYRPIADTKALQRRDLESLRSIPGVIAASWTNQVPLGQSSWNNGGLTTSLDKPDSEIGTTVYMSGDGLLETLGVKLIEGRDLLPEEVVDVDPNQESDEPDSIIVTRALAEQLYPGETRFVGRAFYMSTEDEQPKRIVGVIERLQSPAAPAEYHPAENSVILPIRWLQGYRYAVRTDPGRRDAVMQEAEKRLSANSHDRVFRRNLGFEAIRANRYSGENMMAGLLIAVTGFLLLITASGIVGMASLWVNQRRKQIGVRRALGACRADILSFFLIENLLIVSAGGIVGLVLALLLNDQLVRHLEVTRLPLHYLGYGMLVMWLLGLAAVLAPALRAAQVPPAVATRTA